MPRTGWASAEEREYLTSLIPEYQACQVKKRYKAFWERVNAEFLVKYPVIDKIFPGMNVSRWDMTREQEEVLLHAVNRQKQRLKEWFRWQCNPRSRNGVTISNRNRRTLPEFSTERRSRLTVQTTKQTTPPSEERNPADDKASYESDEISSDHLFESPSPKTNQGCEVGWGCEIGTIPTSCIHPQQRFTSSSSAVGVDGNWAQYHC